MISKETYCELPFNGLFLNTNGDVKFCCALNKPLGNISESPLSEILSGDIATDIRKSILNNTWHDYCGVCKQAERQSGSSQRSFSIRPENFERGKKIKNEHQYNIESIDVRWSNTCNLSCVYCFSGASSKWASLLNEFVIRPNAEDHERFLNEITKHASTIKAVNLLGGEPLLEKLNADLLTKLKDCKQISYYVLSNLSVDNLSSNKIYQLLTETDNVTWAVSFESINNRYDYVRHGSSWNLFQNNIRNVYETTGQKLLIHFTYCVYSATRLTEFFDYLDSVPWFKKVIIQQLVTPSYLNVSFQNTKFRSLCISEIDRCVNKHKDTFTEEMKMLLQIKDALLELPIVNPTNNLEKMISLEKILSKNKDLYSFWPEFQGVLEGNDNDKNF